MKLAEALALKKDYKNKLNQVAAGILANVRSQEGEKPSEDVNTLFVELDDLNNKMHNVVFHINRTNCATNIEFKKSKLTLMELIIIRAKIKNSITNYSNIILNARGKQFRHSSSEIKMVLNVSVKELQKKLDTASMLHREIDLAIQETNWTIDILE